MKYRVGIVGTGDIAYYHAQAMKSMPEVEQVAACDISTKALESFRKQFSVSCYDRLEQMLDNETLDIAIICTWGTLHKEHSNAIARSGKVKAILCEKPISSTAAECQEMIQVAKENNIILIEAFKFRHHPLHLKAKEIIKSGRIGDVCSIHATFSSPLGGMLSGDNWRFDRKRGAGSVYDTASYCINLCHYFIDNSPIRVMAIGQFGETSGADESTALLLEYPGGVTAQISTSYRYCYSQLVTIYGSKSLLRIEMAFNLRQPMDWRKPSLPVTIQILDENLNMEKIEFQSTDQFVEQLRHLCRCLDGIDRPRITLQESLDNMATIDAVYDSMRTGQAAEVKQLKI